SGLLYPHRVCTYHIPIYADCTQCVCVCPGNQLCRDESSDSSFSAWPRGKRKVPLSAESRVCFTFPSNSPLKIAASYGRSPAAWSLICTNSQSCLPFLTSLIVR